jgi:transposase
MEKEDFRAVSEEVRLSIRKRAIRLVIHKKYKQLEVAQMFGIRAATISEWIKTYKKAGFDGLKAKRKGNKSEDMLLLSTSIQKEIQSMILDKMPDQLKLNYALWTRKAIKELIEREFGIVLAINTTGDYLRSWGYSPQNLRKKLMNNVIKRFRNG